MGIINENCTALKYNMREEKEEALKKINALSSELKFEDPNNFVDRFSKTLSIIQANISYFEIACESTDVANNIIEYLKHFTEQRCEKRDMTGEFTTTNELIASLMFTMNNIRLEPNVANFLDDAIIKGSKVEKIHRVTLSTYNRIESTLQHIEMILLEDTDLHSFMDCLKNENVVSSLNKIWVQISIEQDFQSHIKKCFGHLHVPIKIFQSKEELFTSEDFTTDMKMASIWSKDIVGAQNLATFLKKHIIFINTHMKFCAGIILPYTKVLYDLRSIAFNLNENLDEKTTEYDNKYILHSVEDKDKCYTERYDLFYDGKWQKPLKNKYWAHNHTLWANATSEDYEKSKASAIQGFKIWNIKMTLSSRVYVLSQLAAILESKRESSLADEVSKCLKLSLFCMDVVSCDETDQFEIRQVQDPRGIIVLKEKNKVTMFRKLAQSLVTGNSIIVICDPDSCTLAPYCDMFSTAKIPSGVINLLSSKYVNYVNYYENEWEKLNEKQTYMYFTASKHIVINRK